MSGRLEAVEDTLNALPLIGATNAKADWVDIRRRDVLLLVEIAKAAREWDADLSDYCDGPIRDRLRAAFARLDATTTEQTT